MIDVQGMVRYARQMGHFQITDADVQNELNKMDQKSIQDKHKNNHLYEVWDKKSPINGVDAAYFLSREDVDPDTEIYLIKDKDGNVICFQPHEPHVSGHVRMGKTSVHAHAKKHLDEHTDSLAKAEIGDKVMRNLGI